MGGIIIGILLSLGILLAIILLAPIHLEVSGEHAEGFNFLGRFNWVWGLLSIEIIRSKGIYHWSLGGLGLKKSMPKNSKKATPGKKTSRSTKKRASSFGNISAYLNQQLFAAVKTALFKLIRALHLQINLSGTYGFDDPSLTGVVTGLLAALNTGGGSINLDPDFSRGVADIRGSIRGWFSPLQIIIICVIFFLRKPVRAIWWPRIKFRKKQKEAVRYA